MWIEAPKIAYIYSVNGEKYTGDQISVAEVDSASKEDAVRKIAPYPVGKEVEVFYNPKDPKDAVLEKESGDMAFVLLGVLGVGLLIVGVVIWFYPM